MPSLYLPADHTDADLVLAGQIAERIDSAELYVAWTPGAPGPRVPQRPWSEPIREPAPERMPAGSPLRRRAPSGAAPAPALRPPRRARPRPAIGRAADRVRRRARAGAASSAHAASACAAVRRRLGRAAASSCSGGLAPSRAHGSSNSTRHLPSSPCCEREPRAERLARAALEARDRARRAPRGDQLAGDRGRQRLAGLALPDHEAAARVLARPAREALAVLDDVVAADRARAEVGARDADVLELGVELVRRCRARTRRCRP